MELTADLIAIQGILTSKMKQTGEFTKINYKGGKFIFLERSFGGVYFIFF